MQSQGLRNVRDIFNTLHVHNALGTNSLMFFFLFRSSSLKKSAKRPVDPYPNREKEPNQGQGIGQQNNNNRSLSSPQVRRGSRRSNRLQSKPAPTGTTICKVNHLSSLMIP